MCVYSEPSSDPSIKVARNVFTFVETVRDTCQESTQEKTRADEEKRETLTVLDRIVRGSSSSLVVALNLENNNLLVRTRAIAIHTLHITEGF